MKVQDVMTKSVATCEMQDNLQTVAQKLWERDCGCLPVVDRNQRPIAMITDRDACMAALMTGRSLHDLHVAEAMSKDVVSCRAQEDVAAAAQRMQKHGVRRLPVLDANGVLVGVLSLNDLAVAATQEQQVRGNNASAEAIRVLMAVCTHRSNSSATESTGSAASESVPTAGLTRALNAGSIAGAAAATSISAGSLPMSGVAAKTPPSPGMTNPGISANA